MPEKKGSIIGKIGGSVLRLMGGIFSINEFFPQARVEVTAERYLFTKIAYLQPLKKTLQDIELQEDLKWPNEESKELFSLFVEEIQFIVTSLNFSTLLKAFSRYNLKILFNRLTLLFAQKKKAGMKMSELLPPLYKIVQEEFLKQNQAEFRDRYHSSELKKALKIVASEEGEEMGEVDKGKTF